LTPQLHLCRNNETVMTLTAGMQLQIDLKALQRSYTF